MNRYALTFTVTPGSEPEVARILSGYGRPAAGRRPGGPPLLRRTSVFLAGNRVMLARLQKLAGLSPRR